MEERPIAIKSSVLWAAALSVICRLPSSSSASAYRSFRRIERAWAAAAASAASNLLSAVGRGVETVHPSNCGEMYILFFYQVN
jgi:hypothetical protein